MYSLLLKVNSAQNVAGAAKLKDDERDKTHTETSFVPQKLFSKTMPGWYTRQSKRAFKNVGICGKRNYAYTHTHTHTYACTHTHTHTHTHTCMHQTSLQKCGYLWKEKSCIHTDTHICMNTHTNIQTHTHICMYTHTHTPHIPQLKTFIRSPQLLSSLQFMLTQPRN